MKKTKLGLLISKAQNFTTSSPVSSGVQKWHLTTTKLKLTWSSLPVCKLGFRTSKSVIRKLVSPTSKRQLDSNLHESYTQLLFKILN